MTQSNRIYAVGGGETILESKHRRNHQPPHQCGKEGRKGKGDAQSSSNFLQRVTTTQKEKHASPIEKERNEATSTR